MISLGPQNFLKIEEFVLKFSGIVMSRLQQKGIRERIQRHMERLNLQSVDDYLFLLESATGPSVRDELMALVTVGESFFYRNPAQFRFLRQKLLPDLFARKRASGLRLLRAWSAGCSTGEEAYSLAHLLSGLQEQFPEFEMKITAGDINRKNLEWAEHGSYRHRSVRGQVKEFEEESGRPLGQEQVDGSFIVEPALRDLIDFQFQNLHDLESLKSLRGSDIIFCRNVLIYFDETFKEQLVQTFFQVLNPGGMLFLGETESLSTIQNGFKLVSCCGAFGYQKGD